jgi:hypothetical protein
VTGLALDRHHMFGEWLYCFEVLATAGCVSAMIKCNAKILHWVFIVLGTKDIPCTLLEWKFNETISHMVDM